MDVSQNLIASRILSVPIQILSKVSMGWSNESPTELWPDKLYISSGRILFMV